MAELIITDTAVRFSALYKQMKSHNIHIDKGSLRMDYFPMCHV